eukprot:scaffold9806_cov145-Amphora_coffeaeformis.AAC.3
MGNLETKRSPYQSQPTRISVSPVFWIRADKGWSTEQLSRGCIAFPWFFVCGYMAIYASLAFKLWRIGQVMQTHRKIITLGQMLLPLGGVFMVILDSPLAPVAWNMVVWALSCRCVSSLSGLWQPRRASVGCFATCNRN